MNAALSTRMKNQPGKTLQGSKVPIPLYFQRFRGQYVSPKLRIDPIEEAKIDFGREVAELSRPAVQAAASPF